MKTLPQADVVNDNPDETSVIDRLFCARDELRACGYFSMVAMTSNAATHRAFALIASSLKADTLAAYVALQDGSGIVDIASDDLEERLADAATEYDGQ